MGNLTDLKWKKDDFCFHKFELHQVTDVNKHGTVTGLTDGCYFMSDLSGFNDEIFPVSIRLKWFSREFSLIYRELLVKIGLNIRSVNYHNIYNHFVKGWMELCLLIDYEDKCREILSDMERFSNEIFKELKLLSEKIIWGVKIFEA